MAKWQQCEVNIMDIPMKCYFKKHTFGSAYPQNSTFVGLAYGINIQNALFYKGKNAAFSPL